MIYAKSFLFGVGGAIVAALFWIVVSFVLPIFMPMLGSPDVESGRSERRFDHQRLDSDRGAGRVRRCRMVGFSSIQCGALTG